MISPEPAIAPSCAYCSQNIWIENKVGKTCYGCGFKRPGNIEKPETTQSEMNRLQAVYCEAMRRTDFFNNGCYHGSVDDAQFQAKVPSKSFLARALSAGPRSLVEALSCYRQRN